MLANINEGMQFNMLVMKAFTNTRYIGESVHCAYMRGIDNDRN